MIEVKKALETKDTLIFETANHIFKMDQEKLEKITEDTDALRTKIQKGMRQTTNISTGEWFEDSWRAIFKEISGKDPQ